MAPVEGFTEERLMKELLPEVWAGLKKRAGGGGAPRGKLRDVISIPESAAAKGESLCKEPTRRARWRNIATTQIWAGKGGSRKGTRESVLG